MRELVVKGVKKFGIITVSSVLALGFTLSSLVTFVQPQVALAASANCKPQDPPGNDPRTNIVYCGFNGSSVQSAVNDLKDVLQNGDAHGHSASDIRAVYASQIGVTALSTALSDTNYNGSFSSTSSGWAIGSSHHDGTLWVGNDEVGDGMQIASRCFANMSNCKPTSSYPSLVNDVHLHTPHTFFNTNNSPVATLVHFNSKGMVDLAIWIPCGNFIIVVPKTPPVHSLVCTTLSADEVDNNALVRKFTAQATEQNAAITDYVFDFGNSTVKDYQVNQAATASQTTYSFTAPDIQTYSQTSAEQTINTKVTVKGAGFSSDCTKSFTIPAKTVTPSLVCVQLDKTAQGTSQTQFTFTATGSANNTDIKSYTFVFDNDTANAEVINVANNTTATSSVHTFTQGTHTITASVTGSLGTVTSDTCKTTLTVAPLPKTGPGDVFGIFAITSALGTAFHRFVLRRKFVA